MNVYKHDVKICQLCGRTAWQILQVNLKMSIKKRKIFIFAQQKKFYA